MKKIILLIFILTGFFSLDVSAQLRPAQAQYFKETGVLINPGFEQGFKGWDISGCTKSLVSDVPLLNKSLKLTCVNETFSVKQTTNKLSPFLSQQGSADLQIKTSAIGVKFRVGTDVSTDFEQYIDNDTTYKRINNAAFSISNNNEIEIYSNTNYTGEIFIDNVSMNFSPNNFQFNDFDDMPVGSVMDYAGETLPDGYLKADGACLDIVEYPTLYNVLKFAHGACNGSDGFNLPDLRGKFVRGVADGSANDPDRAARTACNTGGNTGDAVGSCQDDELRSHRHTRTTFQGSGFGGTGVLGTARVSPTFTTPTSDGGLTGGAENRPLNVYLYKIIKVKGKSISSTVAQKSLSPDKAGFIAWAAFDGNFEGHLKADGSCVDKLLYPDYVRNVGLTTFGECDAGSGATSGVLLPNLIQDNRFIRAAGGSLAVGSTQTDANASHNHLMIANVFGGNGTSWNGSFPYMAQNGSTGDSYYRLQSTSTAPSVGSTSSSGTTESRPNNMALVPFVRMVDRSTIFGNFDQIEEHTIVEDANTLHRLEVKMNYVVGSAPTIAVDQDSIVSIVGFTTPYATIGIKKEFFSEAPLIHCSYGSNGDFNLNETPQCARVSSTDTATTWGYKFFNYRQGTGYTPRQVDLYFTKTKADQDRNRAAIVVKEKAVQGFQIGDCKMSLLDSTAFNSLHTGSWQLMTGQDITGSKLADVGGFTTMPDAVSSGTFFRQQGGASATIRTYQGDDNKSHYHHEGNVGVGSIDNNYNRFGRDSGYSTKSRPSGSSGTSTGSTRTSTVGAGEARPKNIAVNYYCRID